MLNAKDLDPHNKQHWVGCLKMFNVATSDALQVRINNGEAHLVATHAVVVVFTAFLSSWLDRGRAPLAVVEDASFVLAFVMYWRSHVTCHGSGLTLAANFLTRETFLDIVTACHGCILRFGQFRDNYGGQFKPDGPRITSAFSEYFFQFGRMRQSNSPVVSVMGWARHLDHYLYQQYLEAASDFKLPASCRGIPHSIERVKFDPPPPGWFPTDPQMIASISEGIQRAVALLQGCGVKTDISTRTGFFKRPCKHFPLTDTYVQASGLVATAEKEDDPNGASPDGEEVDLSLVDSQDAADAEAVLTQLMRTATNVEVTTDSEQAAAAFFEEIHRLLNGFNVALQDESKDRKYRFVVKRLMKANQRHADEVDEELDYYRTLPPLTTGLLTSY